MKPVVSAAQIAAQAYAQKTTAPRGTVQAGFTLDPKAIPEKGLTPTRRVSQETEAFKIEISAEALDAASRDGGRPAAPVDQTAATDDVAEIEFQSVDSVSLSMSGSGRREAPFAHEKLGPAQGDAPRLPGSLVDITI